MRASVHHCSVSLLEKKNVCFFTVGRPVDDAKQGNLMERVHVEGSELKQVDVSRC